MKNNKRTKPNQIEGYKYDADHGSPLTRRDFISQGLMSGFAISMIPNLLYSMLKSEIAEAQTSSCSITNPAGLMPFMVLDMAGGLALPGNFVVGKAGGAQDFLASYDFLGMPNSSNPRAVAPDSTYGAPMYTGVSQFLAGLNSVITDPAVRARVKIMTICHSSQDDTPNNALSPLVMVAKAGLVGTLLPAGLGTGANTLTGGNSSSPIIDMGMKPLGIASGSSLASALGMGSALSRLTVAQKARIARAASNMSSGQFSKFSNMTLGNQFAGLAGQSYTKNIDSIAQSASVNPATNSTVATVYGSSAGDANATVVYNTLMGNTGPGAIVVGGCDYHNQGQTTADNKDRECGVELGRMIQLANLLNKPLAIAGISDGGIVYQQGTRNPQGDSGSRGMSFLAVFTPSSCVAPSLIKSQIGAYTDGQVVATGSFFAESPAMASYILFANYLKVCGKSNLFSNVVSPGAFPVSPTDASILGFG